jgi:tetratricopeptide (TPR) repeat protein
MDVEKADAYFKEYKKYESAGLRAKAKEALCNFINSFECLAEKETWVDENVSKLELNGCSCVRYELFEEIIFPVLWKGYENKDIGRMKILAEMEQNCHQNERIREKMNNMTARDIIKECYRLDPNDREVQETYLNLEIHRISIGMHEMPIGILFDDPDNWEEECRQTLNGEIPFIRKLDTENKYQDVINEYENALRDCLEHEDYVGFVSENVKRVNEEYERFASEYSKGKRYEDALRDCTKNADD